MRTTRIILINLILCFLCAMILGCASSGNFRHLADQAKNGNAVLLLNGQSDNIRPGTGIVLTFKSEKSLKGIFDGFERMSPDDYRILYLDYLADNGLSYNFPKPNEQVVVYDKAGNGTIGQFIGFDYGQLCYLPRNDTTYKFLYLSDVSRIEYGGSRELSGAVLSEITMSGNLPIMSAAAIEDNNFRNLVALHRINRVEIIP